MPLPQLVLRYTADATPPPAPPAEPPATPTTVYCGQVLTESVLVANDLSGCMGEGLVIGAPNTVVDLNGQPPGVGVVTGVRGVAQAGNCLQLDPSVLELHARGRGGNQQVVSGAAKEIVVTFISPDHVVERRADDQVMPLARTNFVSLLFRAKINDVITRRAREKQPLNHVASPRYRQLIWVALPMSIASLSG